MVVIPSCLLSHLESHYIDVKFHGEQNPNLKEFQIEI